MQNTQRYNPIGDARLLDRRIGVEAMWPDRRLLDLIGIEIPVIQAPMAGANGSAMSAFGR